MRLYAAGFFTNKKQEEMPAENMLLSYGAKNAREAFDKYLEEQMRIYEAGVPGDSVGARKFIDQSALKNLLFSFAAKQAKAGGEYFLEEQMRLYKAGAFSGKGQNEMLFSTGPQSVLFSFAHSSSRDTCEKVLGEEGHEKDEALSSRRLESNATQGSLRCGRRKEFALHERRQGLTRAR